MPEAAAELPSAAQLRRGFRPADAAPALRACVRMFCGRVPAIRMRTANPLRSGHGPALRRHEREAAEYAIASGRIHPYQVISTLEERNPLPGRNPYVRDAPDPLSTANARGARAKLSICTLPRRPRAEVRARDQGHTALKKQRRHNSVFVPAKTHPPLSRRIHRVAGNS